MALWWRKAASKDMEGEWGDDISSKTMIIVIIAGGCYLLIFCHCGNHNMELVTLHTSHFDMSLLNIFASQNMWSILVTLDTSHLKISPLYFVRPTCSYRLRLIRPIVVMICDYLLWSHNINRCMICDVWLTGIERYLCEKLLRFADGFDRGMCSMCSLSLPTIPITQSVLTHVYHNNNITRQYLFVQ